MSTDDGYNVCLGMNVVISILHVKPYPHIMSVVEITLSRSWLMVCVVSNMSIPGLDEYVAYGICYILLYHAFVM